jgi:thiamine kinase-like enzyme
MHRLAAEALRADRGEILDLKPLAQGMTNRNYTFRCRGDAYILRLPGEGTELLVDRARERDAYRAIEGTGLSDELVYFSGRGVKISRYYENARVCDPASREDVGACMDRLREMHGMGLSVPHGFDIFEGIDRYESLRGSAPSGHGDYEAVKARVFALKPVLDALPAARGLTHLDAVSDNFLMLGDRILLIDWEYAAMCDQHMDIAMFAVYSLYDRAWIDWLTDRYFLGPVPPEMRLKVYCYVAAAGLLWSNWCEYKRMCGVTFEPYAQRQYEYAGEYARLALEMWAGTRP